MQKFILIDESAARELLDALGREFVNQEFEKVHRLFRACWEVVDSPPLVSRSARISRALRDDAEPSVRDSVRVVRIAHRGGEFVIKKG